VRPRHFAGVEIDRPTAEEPVLDPVLPEQLVEVRQGAELIFCFHERSRTIGTLSNKRPCYQGLSQ
jgi:hypothetical protein